MTFTEEIKLADTLVSLRKYQPSDLQEVMQLANDGDLWKFMVTKLTTPEELEQWRITVENGYELKSRYTFMIVDNATGKLAGTTSYGNISWHDKRLEIGWTWLGKEFRNTNINRHCKFLLLSYAFDELGMERVEFKTDTLNLRSRRALQKIGATEEGVLRSHTLMHDGRRRDTIYYSILKESWLTVKNIYFRDLLE
jgi:N-acetyltransferase